MYKVACVVFYTVSIQKEYFMGQHFYTSAELDQIMAEIKEHQHKDMLLRIDEILAVMDTAIPVGGTRKTPRRHVQLIEGKKFSTLSGIHV